MASRTSGLTVSIAGDAKGLQKAVDDADKSLGRLSKSADDSGKKTSKSFGGMGTAAKAGLGGIVTGAAAASAGVVAFAKISVDSAKDVAESITKNQVLFGSYSKSVEEFASKSATAFGISKRAALEYTGVFGNLSRAIGISKKDSAEMSIRLTKLAADLASFNNTSVEDALEALQSGLVGETEPLRKFGVTLSANAVAAEAMRAGIVKTSHSSYEYRVAVLAVEKAEKAKGDAVKKSGKDSLEARAAALALEKANKDLTKAAAGGKVELTAQQKALASVALITRQTKNAQGDFARTSSGAANQQRILTARVEDLKTKVGTALLPVLTKAITGVNKFATEMEHGTGAGGSFSRQVSSLARSLKPYTNATGDAIEASKKHKTVMKALGDVIPNPMRSIRFFTGALDNLKKASDAVVTAVKAVGTALKWTGNAAKDAGGFLKNAAGAMNPIGDGIGQLGAGLPSGTFGGGLMGARPSMAPFASAASRFGLHVSSGKRPGAITSSGNTSYHSSGEAIDVAGSPAGMLGFFRQMKNTAGGRLAELIYTPGGAGVKNGRSYTYGGQVAADHFDHVHVAYDTGAPGVGDGIGQLKSLWTRAGGNPGAQNMAAAIAMAESGGAPNASNRNTDGSIDRGLWQINSIHGGLSTFDRLGNARAAVSISSNGRNWNPWTVFKTGAYKRFLGSASATGPSAGGKRGKTYKKNQSASGGSLGGYDPAVVYASENTAAENLPDPITGMLDGAAGFTQRQASGPVGRPVKGGGPTKGYPIGYTPPEPGQFVSPFAGELRQLGAAGALAALTGDTADDIAVAQRVQDIRGGELDLAKQSGDPDRVREAAENFKSAIDALGGLKAQEQESTKALVDALNSVKDELKRQTDFATSVQSTSNFQLTKSLADLISGHIVGRGVAGRAFTPGSGVEHVY